MRYNLRICPSMALQAAIDQWQLPCTRTHMCQPWCRQPVLGMGRRCLHGSVPAEIPKASLCTSSELNQKPQRRGNALWNKMAECGSVTMTPLAKPRFSDAMLVKSGECIHLGDR